MSATHFKIPILNSNWRLALWILVILLSTILLVFPTHMSVTIQIYQAPYIFDNLFLFGILFVIWTILLLILLITKGSDLEKLAIVLVFTMVFNGFWKIAFGGVRGIEEAYAFANDMRLIGQYGRLPPSNVTMVYQNFPGFDLFGYSLHTITGIDYMPQLEKVISLLFYCFSAAMLYLIAKRILKDNRASAISALVFIVSNAQLVRTYAFQARYFGWCLLLFIIACIFSSRKGGALSGIVLLTLGFVALNMTHAPSTLFIIIVFLCTYVIQWSYTRRSINKLESKSFERMIPNFSYLILLAIILFAAWEMYYANGIFESTVLVLPRGFSEISHNIITTVNTFFAQSQAHIGPGIPEWVKMTEFVWIGITMGLASVIGLWYFFHLNKLDTFEKIAICGGVAAILSTIVSIVIGRSSEEYFRIFLFLPIFSVPILVKLLVKQPKLVIVALTIIFLCSILPTFLVDNKETPNNIMFPQEIASAKFVEATHDQDILTPVSSVYVLPGIQSYYAPDANVVTPYGFLNDKQAETFMTNVLSSELSSEDLNSLKQNIINNTPLLNLNVEYILKNLRLADLSDEEVKQITEDDRYNSFVNGISAHPTEEMVSSLLIAGLTDYQVAVLEHAIQSITVNELISGMDIDRVNTLSAAIDLKKLLTDRVLSDLINSLRGHDQKQPEDFIYCEPRVLLGKPYDESRPITQAIWNKLHIVLAQQQIIYNDGLVQIYRF